MIKNTIPNNVEPITIIVVTALICVPIAVAVSPMFFAAKAEVVAKASILVNKIFNLFI
ncbi:hypothetical protein C408_1440 [Vibrio diabolicus E0666]|nr:hypothetical protein C408_1440 [Vibrio diabolicus E0666]